MRRRPCDAIATACISVPTTRVFPTLRRCARRWATRLIGLSCGTVDEALAAASRDVDYLGVGAVYATGSKPDAGAPIGIDGLMRVAGATRFPVAAIGGIDAFNLGTVARTGVAMAAVISAIAGDPDPAFAAAPAGAGLGRGNGVIVLSIGTSHPWNVAGVGRDLIVATRLNRRVFTAIAAVSAQDARGVRALHAVPADAFRAQLSTLPWDAAGAVRVGALATVENVRAVAAALRARPSLDAVVDPVFAASRGGPLADPAARTALAEELARLPNVILTPNLDEAAAVARRASDRSRRDRRRRGRASSARCAGGAAQRRPSRRRSGRCAGYRSGR